MSDTPDFSIANKERKQKMKTSQKPIKDARQTSMHRKNSKSNKTGKSSHRAQVKKTTGNAGTFLRILTGSLDKKRRNAPEQAEQSYQPQKSSHDHHKKHVHKNRESLIVKPKDLVVGNRSIEEEAYKKMLDKLKERKDRECESIRSNVVEASDLRSQICLDRVKKTKTGVLQLDSLKKEKEKEKDSSKSISLTRLVLRPSACEVDKKRRKKKKKLLEEHTQDVDPEDVAKEKETIQKESLSDKYDDIPKISEIFQNANDNVYDGTGNPHWMSVLEPTDDDLKDTDPAVSVGSEHIQMLHDKKFVLKMPPDSKIVLDQWQKMWRLKDRDEKFFSPELIFCNTIRSLINVAIAPKGKKKKKKNTTKKPRDAHKPWTKTLQAVPSTTLIPGFKAGGSNELTPENKTQLSESESQTQECCGPLTVVGGDTTHFFVYLRAHPLGGAVLTDRANYDAGTYPPLPLVKKKNRKKSCRPSCEKIEEASSKKMSNELPSISVQDSKVGGFTKTSSEMAKMNEAPPSISASEDQLRLTVNSEAPSETKVDRSSPPTDSGQQPPTQSKTPTSSTPTIPKFAKNDGLIGTGARYGTSYKVGTSAEAALGNRVKLYGTDLENVTSQSPSQSPANTPKKE